MKKLIFILIVVIYTTNVFSQNTDCSNIFNYRKTDKGYTLNHQSKSALCKSNASYEFTIVLEKNIRYKLSFFASSVFNNDMRFTLKDSLTKKVLLDLPGKTETSNKGETVLSAYFDKYSNKMIHPSFEFFSTERSVINVYIKIPEFKTKETKYSLEGEIMYIYTTLDVSGCVSMFLQESTEKIE